MQLRFFTTVLISAGLLSFQSDCSKHDQPGDHTPTTPGLPVSSWLTTGDQLSLLEKQNDIAFGAAGNSYSNIDVDTTQTFQSIDGFGYALTDGSAYLINHMADVDKNALLQEFFGHNDNSIGISFIRISIGASDLNASVFSYDDLATGQTDVNLDQFSLSQDTIDLIPVLKKLLQINPAIKILASPWSPPLWMKDNGNSIGGGLQTQYYDAYSRYFVKYIQQMQANGITITAVTPQNEPLYGGNNPSMVLTDQQEGAFVKNNLGPAFQTAGLSTKIIVYDHNCDRPDYPINILNDAAARPFVDGSAFHLYAGDISALSTVHNAYPDKNLYFTEQWTGANESFSGDLTWHEKNVIIGTIRNWGKAAIEWNLASDPTNNPHTAGGCSECRGAVTIGAAVTRNVSYYIVAHASKFVPPGSVRIASTVAGNLNTAAFKTPAGKKVLIVENDGTTATNFNIRFNGQLATTSLRASSIATFVW